MIIVLISIFFSLFVDDDQSILVEPQQPPKSKKKGAIFPIKVTKEELPRHINILLTEEDGNCHYSSIVNFSGLLRSQYSKYHGTYFYCYSCLHGFVPKKGEKTREQCVNLQEHHKHCKTQKPQRISYPIKGKQDLLQFTSIHKQLKMPFVVYADFESCLKKESDIDTKTGWCQFSIYYLFSF